MNCNYGNATVSEYRIQTFIEQGDGAMLTGERRAGIRAHMRSIVRVLREYVPDIIVLDAEMSRDEVLGFFKDRMRDGDTVAICSITEIQEWEELMIPFVRGQVTVYCGQELCHQVPVCFKRVIIR